MNAKDWIAAYAERLETPAPSPDDCRAILELAAEATHASERGAAPVACWLAAASGHPLADAIELAAEVRALERDEG